jgi:putative flippase GtrA
VSNTALGTRIDSDVYRGTGIGSKEGPVALVHRGAGLHALFLRIRLLRVCGTGVVSGPAHLGVYVGLTHAAWSPPVANALALLVTTQLSFVLSCMMIWPDRGGARARLLQRWAAFQGSAIGTSVLNMLLFVVLLRALPDLVAVCMANVVGAIICYILNDRLVFRAADLTSWPSMRSCGT